MEVFKSLKLNYDWLFEKKVAIGIIDTSELIQNQLLLSVSKNIIDYWFEDFIRTTSNKNKIEKLVNVNTDPDDIITWASESNYEYVLVSSLGTSFKNTGPEFFTVLEKFLNETPQDNITIVGHILDKQEEYYQLHHQMFLVNLDWWRKNGKPKLGNQNNEPKTLSIVTRSSESHHDGYTPLWIEQGSGTQNYTKTHFGWNIIETALQSGKRVHSFNSDLRRSKYYFYPEVKSDAHTKQHHITKWLLSMGKHFIANTESFWKIPNKNFDSVICSAGGISPLMLAWQLNLKPDNQLFITDVNHFALVCQKKLLDALISKSITVNQIESYLTNMSKEFDVDNNNGFQMFHGDKKINDMQKEINAHSSELQNFVDTVLPNIRIIYKDIDYFNDSPGVAKRIEKLSKGYKKVYINVSNIFHYYPTSLLYSYDERYDIFKRLFTALDQQNSNKYFTSMLAESISTFLNDEMFNLMTNKKEFDKVRPQWKK